MKYLNLIPSNWKEIKLSTYIKIINELPADEPDDETALDYLEIYFYHFTGKSLADSNIKADEFRAIINKLSFLKELPTNTNTTYKTKTVDTLNYIDFVDFQKLQNDPIRNLPAIVKMFSIDEVDVDNLNMEDAMVFFCSVNKQLKQSVNTSKISLSMKIIKLSIKAYFKKIKQWLMKHLVRSSAG